MNTSTIQRGLTLILLVVLGSALLAKDGNATSRIESAQDAPVLVGDWMGDSICQVKNSPCHDEKVVYHIAKGSEQNHLKVSADKIVDGKAIDMGTLDFTYDPGHGSLLSETEGRVWQFVVKGNKMDGTLTMPDRTIYRRVSLTKTE